MSISKRLLERSWTRLTGVDDGDLRGPCGVCHRDDEGITFVVEDGMGQTYPACHSCAIEHGMICEVCCDRPHDGLIVWLFTEDRSGQACDQCARDFAS